MDTKTINIQVFNDTINVCKNNIQLLSAIKDSNERQKIILESEKIDINNIKKKDRSAIIKVSKKRSFQAAKEYKGKKICVHNFASATTPGGGVRHGSSAQEEGLCRCSTLYPNISATTVSADFYMDHISMIKKGIMTPLYNDDCIYTPGIIVFKSDIDIPEIMEEKDWYKADVITMAAPNLRSDPTNHLNRGSGKTPAKISEDDLMKLHVKRMSRFCDIAAAFGDEVLILGAFGCGAFQNPPEIVAQAMKVVIEKYKCYFEIIEFAVYCRPNNMHNYEVFSKILGK